MDGRALILLPATINKANEKIKQQQKIESKDSDTYMDRGTDWTDRQIDPLENALKSSIFIFLYNFQSNIPRWMKSGGKQELCGVKVDTVFWRGD